MSGSSEPQLMYSLIARGQTVLCEYAAVSGNFAHVARRILEKVPTHDSKLSYVYDEYNVNFHYVVQNGICYMSMTDKEYSRRIAFQFLDDISHRFRSAYGDRSKTASSMQYQDDFSRTLHKQIDHYNKDNPDKIARVRKEIDSVKSVMVENIDRVIERGDKIDLLVDKTEKMNQEAVAFKKAGTRLKRSMWLKNLKMILVFVLVALILAFIIFLFACGGFKCVNGGSHDKGDKKK